MEIKQMLLTKNEYSRPAKMLVKVCGIVIHYVGNPGSSAIANRNYWEALKNGFKVNGQFVYASAHFIVGLGGEVIQTLPDCEMGYHAGAKTYKSDAVKRLGSYPNNCTIGIELCHADKSGKFNSKTQGSAERLTAMLLSQHGLCIDDVYRHYDITGKDCPRYFVRHADAWEEFKSNVAKIKDIFSKS